MQTFKVTSKRVVESEVEVCVECETLEEAKCLAKYGHGKVCEPQKPVASNNCVFGDNCFEIRGDLSTLKGGKCSTIKGGKCSTIKGGNYSTITGGDGSTLTGGNDSTLTGGDGSTLTGGNGSTLTGGDGSTLQGGKGSTLIIWFCNNKTNSWDTNHCKVDGVKILCDTPYKLDKNGKFVKA